MDLLRQHKVALVGPDGQAVPDAPLMGGQAWWWHAVSGPASHPVVKLYEPVLVGKHVTVAGEWGVLRAAAHAEALQNTCWHDRCHSVHACAHTSSNKAVKPQSDQQHQPEQPGGPTP